MNTLLRLHNISKIYETRQGLLGFSKNRVHAVNEVTLDINAGETLGLVGESGCGKSTLARLILGLEKPSSGQVEFKGVPINKYNQAEFRKKVQLVFQDPYSSLNPRRTIGATVQEILDIHKQGTRAQREEKVLQALALVGLPAEYAKRYPHEFSGGQRQRVAIARTLIMKPQCLVCDEPVSALDVSIRAQVLNLFTTLQKKLQLAMLFISHDLSVVGYVAQKIAVMYLGKIVECADTQTILHKAMHPYTRALLAAILTPNPKQKTLHLPLAGEPPSPLAPPPGCPFHPRCSKAMPVCVQKPPQLQAIHSGHKLACWLPNN